jgi:predicted ATPase
MIDNIKIHSFKSHKSTEIELQNLTVLCGVNGVGKSSAIQVLLLLREAFIKDKSFDVLDLKCNSVKIGTVNDAIYEFSDNDSFEISLLASEKVFNFKYEAQTEEEKVKSFINLVKEKSIIPRGFQLESIFNTNFQYISAYRLGPQTQYKKEDKIIDIYKQISDIDGNAEYFVHFLDRYRNNEVLPEICNSNVPFNDLFSQVIAWEKEISDGVNIDIQDLGKLGYVLKYSFDTEKSVSKKTKNFEATNVGFGLSYVMPILVAILSAKKDSLIIIENPEAHLHPNGIAKLTELICLASQAGIQIILETHSDHIINGILVQCKKFEEGNKGINRDNVSIYQFDRDETEHCTRATKITLESNGHLRYPPEGFFDQFTIDRKFLMGF